MADKFIESDFDIFKVFIKIQMVLVDIGDGDDFRPVI